MGGAPGAHLQDAHASGSDEVHHGLDVLELAAPDACLRAHAEHGHGEAAATPLHPVAEVAIVLPHEARPLAYTQEHHVACAGRGHRALTFCICFDTRSQPVRKAMHHEQQRTRHAPETFGCAADESSGMGCGSRSERRASPASSWKPPSVCSASDESEIKYLQSVTYIDAPSGCDPRAVSSSAHTVAVRETPHWLAGVFEQPDGAPVGEGERRAGDGDVKLPPGRLHLLQLHRMALLPIAELRDAAVHKHRVPWLQRAVSARAACDDCRTALCS